MSIPLRPAARYAALEQRRHRLARAGIDLDEALRTDLAPALMRFEEHWLTPSEKLGIAQSRAGIAGIHLLKLARSSPELSPDQLFNLHQLLVPDGDPSYRTQPAPQLTLAHQPLPPERVVAATERFFGWATSQAFQEMHAVEQMSIAQARLIEIQPLQSYSRLTVSFFAQYFLLHQAHPFALYPEAEQAVFDEALNQAFGFSTEALVGWNLAGCEKAYEHLVEEESR